VESIRAGTHSERIITDCRSCDAPRRLVVSSPLSPINRSLVGSYRLLGNATPKLSGYPPRCPSRSSSTASMYLQLALSSYPVEESSDSSNPSPQSEMPEQLSLTQPTELFSQTDSKR